MSNSPLVDYTQISPNSTRPRRDKIKKITIHHMAGNWSIETVGNAFSNVSRQASSNYGIGTDGRVGMYVEEKNRAWTSGNADNDNQAITIETANDRIGADWHVSDKALAKLVELCADICKRNGIDRLNYTGDASGNLTKHNMFSATACPGPYLESKMQYIADEVNKLLDKLKQPEPEKISLVGKKADPDGRELDNTPNGYAREAIIKAVDAGVLKGNEIGNLMLHDGISRQDMLVILDRLNLL